MKTNKKTLALVVAATLGLAGCLDDPYDGYPTETPNPGITDPNALSWGVDLYREPSGEGYIQSPYQMYIKDHLGQEQAVVGSDIELDNVTLSGDVTTLAPLHVQTRADVATLYFASDKTFNLGITYNGNNTVEQQKKGTLQFKVQPKGVVQPSTQSEATTEPTFFLTMGKGEQKVKIDITSAVIASNGSTIGQHIKVPMKCFEDLGIDMSKVDIPFGLESTGAVDYKFSEARLIANSHGPTPGQANVLSCETNNVVAKDATSTVIKRFKTEGGVTPPPEGWAKKAAWARGTQISPAPAGTPFAYDGIYYDANAAEESKRYQVGKPSFLIFILGDDQTDLSTIETPRMDLSHYMEKGTLNFTLFVPPSSTPTHEGLNLMARFEAPTGQVAGTPNKGYHPSYNVAFDLTKIEKNKEIQVSIPVKNFFTNPADNTIRHNSLQFVEKLVTYIDRPTGDKDLSGMRYGISNVYLTLDTTTAP